MNVLEKSLFYLTLRYELLKIMDDKTINKFIFKLQPNLFVTSIMPKVFNSLSFGDTFDDIDAYFIQYIIDSFRYLFNKTLDNDDIKSLDKLIYLLENIIDLNISDKIEELINNPRNRRIQSELKSVLKNKEEYIKSIIENKNRKPYLSGFINSIYEIGNRFIADDINNAIEEQRHFLLAYLKKIYQNNGKFTLTKPDERNKNQKIYFNSPEELYKNAIDNLKELKSKDSIKLMPFNFSNDKFETKKILNSRKERNTDLRRFICFLNFYLKSCVRSKGNKKDKKKIKYFIFIILMLSPFADYVANNMKYSKKVLKLCIKKISEDMEESDEELIFGYFNINYNERSIEDEYIKSKASKEFDAFFRTYLKQSEKLKKEYDGLKEEFYKGKVFNTSDIGGYAVRDGSVMSYRYKVSNPPVTYITVKENYILEDIKFNPKCYELKLPLVNSNIGMKKEFPKEETDKISEFLKEQISTEKYHLIETFKLQNNIIVPTVRVMQSPYEKAPEFMIRDIHRNIKKEIKPFLYIRIIEYYLPPNLYKRILEFKLKQTSNKNYITL